jgi:hypothetical protein
VRAVYAKDCKEERNWVINTLPRTVQNSAIALPGRIADLTALGVDSGKEWMSEKDDRRRGAWVPFSFSSITSTGPGLSPLARRLPGESPRSIISTTAENVTTSTTDSFHLGNDTRDDGACNRILLIIQTFPKAQNLIIYTIRSLS